MATGELLWTPPPVTVLTPNGAVNANVSLSNAGTSRRTIRVVFVQWSYSAAPAGGRLTIADEHRTIVDIDITTAGTDSLWIPPGGLACQEGDGLNIVLFAGGAGITGKLNAGILLGS